MNAIVDKSAVNKVTTTTTTTSSVGTCFRKTNTSKPENQLSRMHYQNDNLPTTSENDLDQSKDTVHHLLPSQSLLPITPLASTLDSPWQRRQASITWNYEFGIAVWSIYECTTVPPFENGNLMPSHSKGTTYTFEKYSLKLFKLFNGVWLLAL